MPLAGYSSPGFWWQALQILTGWSQPRDGTARLSGEHSSHTPWPHARQWWMDRRGRTPAGTRSRRGCPGRGPSRRAAPPPSPGLRCREEVVGGGGQYTDIGGEDASQTLTGARPQPRSGTGRLLEEQASQKPSPQARQCLVCTVSWKMTTAGPSVESGTSRPQRAVVAFSSRAKCFR
ncbi:hypothetical protein CRUP_023595 [Coryphaenoides rupestris]|nr:hypothetical protein CRUP_023595 [Coryphaenoides rupestris]